MKVKGHIGNILDKAMSTKLGIRVGFHRKREAAVCLHRIQNLLSYDKKTGSTRYSGLRARKETEKTILIFTDRTS